MIESVACFNVSPKLANSLVRSQTSAVSIGGFREIREARFKFAVSKPKDIDEVEGLISDCGLPCDGVLLMPEGLILRFFWGAALGYLTSASNGGDFRSSPRLHIPSLRRRERDITI